MKISLLLLIVPFTVLSQDYQYWVDSAYHYYEEKEFLKSVNAFEKAFEFEDVDPLDQYQAACSNALAGRTERAVSLLKEYFTKFDNTDFQYVYYDIDFDPIRQNDSFKAFEAQYKPDSTLFFFDLVKLLQSDEEIVRVRDMDISLFSDYYGGDHTFGLGAYEKSELKKRLLLETGDSSLVFDKKTLMFFNCKFIVNDDISEINFLPYLTLQSLYLEDCSATELHLNQITVNSLLFNGNRIDHLEIDSLNLNGAFSLINEGEWLDISNSNFVFNPTRKEKDLETIRSSHSYSYLEVSGSDATLMIYDNTFKNHNDSSDIFSMYFAADHVEFYKNTFHVPLNFNGTAATELEFSENKFKHWLDISSLKLPEFNCYFPFGQLDSRLVRIYSHGSYNASDWTIVGSEGIIDDEDDFNMITDSYKRLYNNYRARGELKSANASYVVLKELEVAHLKVKGSRTFEETMRLRLNQIMGFYTDYGTSPGKAIIISFYIILVFAVFYFFFPSEWDKATKHKMISDYRDFIKKNEHGYQKPFFKLMKGLFLSFINAIVLSVNSFVTLGFGAIPTTGLARYICVLQGLLGWFLLSLFTVALINQVL